MPQSAAVLDPGRLHLHIPKLTRFATGLTGSRHHGEDLVQDTLERVLRAPRRVIGDEFRYLARALRNNHIDWIRSEARRPTAAAEPAIIEAQLPAAAGIEKQFEARVVLAAVAELPAGFRDAVVAVDVVGCSYAEAAERLGIPVGTVMSRLYRGRDQVIRALED